jgi:hypothetical protein
LAADSAEALAAVDSTEEAVSVAAGSEEAALAEELAADFAAVDSAAVV